MNYNITFDSIFLFGVLEYRSICKSRQITLKSVKLWGTLIKMILWALPQHGCGIQISSIIFPKWRERLEPEFSKQLMIWSNVTIIEWKKKGTHICFDLYFFRHWSLQIVITKMQQMGHPANSLIVHYSHKPNVL